MPINNRVQNAYNNDIGKINPKDELSDGADSTVK